MSRSRSGRFSGFLRQFVITKVYGLGFYIRVCFKERCLTVFRVLHQDYGLRKVAEDLGV